MLQSGDPALEFYELQANPEPKTVHQLIYEHLVHHCFDETALEFGNHCKLVTSSEPGSKSDDGENLNNNGESGRIMDEDSIQAKEMGEDDSMDLDNDRLKAHSIELMELRKKGLKMVLEGSITDALHFFNLNFPALLNMESKESINVAFVLKCQEFIEMVRIGAPETLEFAQSELGSFADLNDSCTEILQDVISLIAYPDPMACPLSHYLSQARREFVATTLNNYIISCHGGNNWTALERLVQQSTLVRESLFDEASKESKSPKIVYPKWSLPVFLI